MSFANLKRGRTDVSKLVEAANGSGATNKQSPGKDERFWQPTVDKAGNGYAVLRFLPGDAEAATPWVRYWDHGFKGPTGQWYIEKSLSSIGQPDPVGEANALLWNSGIESNKSIVRERKRNLRYVANVLVVSDPSNPANEGQVKLFRFGKKIFDKIMDVMQPQFPDEKPVNPFDMWEGADFVLKIRNVEGYRNYDKSEFKSPAAVMDDDAQLEVLYNKQHDLSEWTDPKNYKSYDELKTRLAAVLGESAPRTFQAEVALDEVQQPPSMPTRRSAVETSDAAGEDDTLSYFAKLAAED
jgi:hypothetical protein